MSNPSLKRGMGLVKGEAIGAGGFKGELFFFLLTF